MKKGLRISFNAPVTICFTLLACLAYLLGSLTDGAVTGALFMTWHSPLAEPLTWIRFFTHVLGHAGLSHLIGNLTYILLLGPLLEEKYGAAFLFKVIALTAFLTGVINYLLFPDTALLGASGVVFAFIILSSITGARAGEIPLTFLLAAVIYLGGQVYEGMFSADNVSNISHIAGGLIGAAAGFGYFGRR